MISLLLTNKPHSLQNVTMYVADRGKEALIVKF